MQTVLAANLTLLFQLIAEEFSHKALQKFGQHAAPGNVWGGSSSIDVIRENVLVYPLT